VPEEWKLPKMSSIVIGKVCSSENNYMGNIHSCHDYTLPLMY
jgi:hypothetical protein